MKHQMNDNQGSSSGNNLIKPEFFPEFTDAPSDPKKPSFPNWIQVNVFLKVAVIASFNPGASWPSEGVTTSRNFMVGLNAS